MNELQEQSDIFEIGGKNKPASQVANIPNGYIVKDDLQFPAGNALPLWIFGFIC